MATIQYTTTYPGYDKAIIVSWVLASGDVGVPFEYPVLADRSVQFAGSFGASGTVAIEGSNDGTNWAPLTDLQGTSLNAVGTASIEGVTEITRYIRPKSTTVSSVTVTLFAKAA